MRLFYLKDQMKFNNANVLITGGASGIGRIMGRMALEKGAARLIIWDINQNNIEVVKKELSSKGQVSGYRVDVSDKNAIVEAYLETVKECGEVDIVIQCAGIVTSNETAAYIVELLREETTADDIKKAMAERYDAPYEVISKDVDMVLDKLISIGVVDI